MDNNKKPLFEEKKEELFPQRKEILENKLETFAIEEEDFDLDKLLKGISDSEEIDEVEFNDIKTIEDEIDEDLKEIANEEKKETLDEERLKEIVEFVLNENTISSVKIKNKFDLSYEDAAKLIDLLVKQNIIGNPDENEVYEVIKEKTSEKEEISEEQIVDNQIEKEIEKEKIPEDQVEKEIEKEEIFEEESNIEQEKIDAEEKSAEIDEISQLIKETDLIEVIKSYGIELKKKGNNYYCKCPFHDDKKCTMAISKEKQIFNCFECLIHGNVIDFIVLKENVSFEEAVDKIKNKEINKEVKENKNPKKIDSKKQNKIAKITTIILTILVGLLLFKTLMNFYVGFKYRNIDENKTEEKIIENKKEEKVAMDSIIFKTSYEKIKPSVCPNILTNSFYKDKKVEYSSLSNKEIILSLYFYFNNQVCNEELFKTSEEVKNALIVLFGNDKALNNLKRLNETNYEVLDFIYVSETDTFSFTNILCENCNINGEVLTKVIDVTSSEELLYVYEKYAYSLLENNVYKVYNLKNKEIASYNENEHFNNHIILPGYKWTFKRANNNDYYFVSIETI
ncbi:MAG: hypothetical protein E7172_00115 [Firmicutes bacterium]|nr:hypothetical protein [Bacillota bacterium]